jgi:tRNA (mo5U34)-methyltransferase
VTSGADLASEVASQALWYHTLDLPQGVVTPGWFDLRPIVDRMPWPDVEGKRCLDVATYDGFLAFELERRGASEVVATDIPHHEDWDWLPRERRDGIEFLRQEAGMKGRGFEIAARALDSKVDRRILNVYDLSPEEVGEFDVVVCGSLMLHLRDPFRALAAIRSVCRGEFLSAEQIEIGLSTLHQRRPAFRLRAKDGQWMVPNAAGHRQMLEAAGFDVVETARPYAIPSGVAHSDPPRSLAHLARVLALKGTVGGAGVPMSALRCRPAAL